MKLLSTIAAAAIVSAFWSPVAANAQALPLNAATSALVNAVLPDASPKISRSQATQIALGATHGGTVHSVQYDGSEAKPYWQVEISKRTAQFEVDVDARTGSVLRVIKQQEG